MENKANSEVRTSHVEKLLSKIPHTLVIIFSMIVLAVICSHIVPAGMYERVEIDGIITVVPDSFQYIEQSPVNPFRIFTALYDGMVNATSIIVFILIIGGATGVLTETKAIDAIMTKVILGKNGKKNQTLILIMIASFFAFLGGVVGIYEETLVFLPFAIMAAIAMGYDAVVGVSIGYLAMCVGFSSALMSPFTLAIAQDIAGLPIYSGMGYRAIIFIVMEAITLWYILRYGKKVKQNPEYSLVYKTDYSEMHLPTDSNQVAFTGRRKIVLIIFVVMLIVLVIAVIFWNWGLGNMSGLFMIMAIVSGLVVKMNASEIAERFSKGVADIAFVGLLVGIARGVTVVLNEGMIIDSIINTLVQPLSLLPQAMAAVSMYFIQGTLNFFVPSGSGQAMIAMPIMIPIADLLGINRQVAVLAFQLGDGLTNMIIPMAGATSAAIQMGKIPFGKWLPFAGKLLLILSVVSCIFIYIAQLINYGPF